MATNTNKKQQVFNFWKENQLSGFFQLNEEQLIERFSGYLKTKQPEWIDYYSISDIVSVFISDGLNAIGNSDDNFSEYRAMETLLKPVKRAYLDNLKK